MIYNPFAKIIPVRSKRYREFIASVPCLVTGLKAEPHHESIGINGTGIKVSDLQCLPLCRDFHTIDPRSRHRHPGGAIVFWMEHNINPAQEMLRLINYFLSNGGKV